MKRSILILTLLTLFISCNKDAFESIHPNDATYTSFNLKKMTLVTVALKPQGEKVIITRSLNKIRDRSFYKENANQFYFNTDKVDIQIEGKTAIVTSKESKTKIWFIPYQLGTEAIQIGGPGLIRKCIKLRCNCSGDIGPGIEQEEYCSVVQSTSSGHIGCVTQSGYWCGDYINAGCVGFATIELCNDLHDKPDTTLAQQAIYTGGVILEALEVIIKDPEWYQGKKHTFEFIQDEDGTIYKKEDYDARQESHRQEKGN